MGGGGGGDGVRGRLDTPLPGYVWVQAQAGPLISRLGDDRLSPTLV